jgi:hypothetical protein
MNSNKAYRRGLDLVSSTSVLSKFKKASLYTIFLFVILFALSSLVEMLDFPAYSIKETYGPQIKKRPIIVSSVAPTKEILYTYDSYDFSKAQSFSRKTNLVYLSHVDKQELEDALLMKMPYNIRMSAKKYIKDILHYSEVFQVDPVWTLAVIWTESHFRSYAKSRVSATGLMQIMPRTGKFLVKLLKRPSDKRLVRKLIKDPRTNIELGTYYLRRLIKRFGLHQYATVAYNMGPSYVSKRLKRGRPVGNRNLYFDKVARYYYILQKGVRELERETKTLAKDSFVLRLAPIDITYYFGHDLHDLVLPRYALR